MESQGCMQAAASKDGDALLESDRRGQAREGADRARMQEEEGSQASCSPGYYEKRIILIYMTPGPGRDKMYCHQQTDLTVQIPWTVCDRS